MPLSRNALVAAIAFSTVPAAASAQASGADAAIDAQRQVVREAIFARCTPTNGSEIVVCGRRPEDGEGEGGGYRVAAPPEDPGILGQAGGLQLRAMRSNGGSCSTIGPNQRCGGGLNVIGIGRAVFRGLRALRGRRD